MPSPPITRAELWEALANHRSGEALRIAEQLVRRRFVGLEGESGVGKSPLLRRAVAYLYREPRVSPGYVDLDGAWGIGRTAWLFFHAAAEAVIGPVAMSHLTAGFDEALLPSQSRRARFNLYNLLGDERLTEAILSSDALEDDPELLQHALSLFAQLTDVLLVIDHLEAPNLPARHPLDVDQLLWQLRSIHQRSPSMHICVCGRPDATDRARRESAAFYDDGLWLTITPPTSDVWQYVAADAWEDIDLTRLDEILRLTEGQPASTIAMLLQDERASVLEAAARAADDLAPAADRAVQHARSLHRLGAHLLLVIARNERPYSAVPKGRAEVTRALTALRSAGLITKRGRGQWRLAEPLLAAALVGAEHGLGFDATQSPIDSSDRASTEP